MSRTRSRIIPGQQYKGILKTRYNWTDWSVSELGDGDTTVYDSVTDVVGHGTGDCHAFSVVKYNPPKPDDLRGNSSPFQMDTYTWIELQDVLMDWDWRGYVQVPGVTPAPPVTVLATKLAASTNPSRSLVDVSVALGELRELPGLFRSRHLGNQSLGSDGRLQFRFGIAPMLQDLQSLFKFQKSVEKRMQELERLYSRGGLRRTRDLGTYSTSTFGAPQNMSRTAWFKALSVPTKATTEKYRGHIRWLPTSRPKAIPSSDRLRSEAQRALLGGGLSHQAMWELVPYSWLVDWFTTVGDYLAATNNAIPAQISELVIMCETTNEVTWAPPTCFHNAGWPLPQITTTGGNCSMVTKTRTRVPIGLAAHLPLLNAGQVLTATDLLLKMRK